MRLIDADTLKGEFTGNFHETWHWTGVKTIIDNAPTAYDVEEVVSLLEGLIGYWSNEAQMCIESKDYEEAAMCHARVISFKTALEIVKSGGNIENGQE